jgi:hypothetical protein
VRCTSLAQNTAVEVRTCVITCQHFRKEELPRRAMDHEDARVSIQRLCKSKFEQGPSDLPPCVCTLPNYRMVDGGVGTRPVFRLSKGSKQQLTGPACLHIAHPKLSGPLCNAESLLWQRTSHINSAPRRTTSYSGLSVAHHLHARRHSYTFRMQQKRAAGKATACPTTMNVVIPASSMRERGARVGSWLDAAVWMLHARIQFSRHHSQKAGNTAHLTA